MFPCSLHRLSYSVVVVVVVVEIVVGIVVDIVVMGTAVVGIVVMDTAVVGTVVDTVEEYKVEVDSLVQDHYILPEWAEDMTTIADCVMELPTHGEARSKLQHQVEVLLVVVASFVGTHS